MIALEAIAGSSTEVHAGAKCYATRYEVQSGGVVHDASTGLTWRQSVPGVRNQQAAVSYCSGLGGSWRLPSMKELQTIVDDTKTNPSIDANAFPNTPNPPFWSSSPVLGRPGITWVVSFYGGISAYGPNAEEYHVRCVR